ncbi:response regulator [Bacteroides sp. K03]|uniref:ATP-binding protein n=1 Tax=Bacteroides sp. K03 TaxID=2718928 RepID=UPI001C8BFAB2|nr:ATP-binding protein [Bacteroides sp. K03]MBX9186680.1 response regulator [Bacteroides sp. K03]
MKTCLLTIFLILFIPLQIQAIHFNKLNTKDGLAHPSVFAITQDSLGRIWFGTAEGISVYDGNTITSYKPSFNTNDISSFEGSIVSNIVCSTNGDVFFQTSEALVKYNIRKRTFQSIQNKGNLPLYSQQGAIWVVIDHTLYRWNEDKEELVPQIEKLPTANTRALVIDKKGRKWFSYYGGIFYTDDDKHFNQIINKISMTSMFLSSNGDIWVGSSNDGLFRIQPDGTILTYNTSNSLSKGLHDNKIRKITEDKYGNIWFGTFTGLYRYNLQNDKFTSYTRENKSGSITDSSIHTVFVDKSGILWIGSYFGGVNYASINQNSFNYYNTSDHPNTLSHPVVGCMAEDSQGNIWICTEGGGLNMLNPKKEAITRFNSTEPPFFQPHPNLKSALHDPKSKLLYIGTYGKGLYTYNPFTNTFKAEIGQDKTSDLNIINTIIQNGDNLFLSAAKGIYIYSLKRKEAQLFYKTNKSSHVLLDTDTCLWVAVNEQLCKFDIKTRKQLSVYNLRKQGFACTIRQIFESSQKEIYITTSQYGVMKLNRKTQLFEPFPQTPSSLLNQYCYRIAETSEHNLIVTGDNGIAFMSEKGVIQQVLSVGSPSLPLDAFTSDCGLKVDREGQIYIGGTNGLVIMKEKKENLSINDQLYFTELYVHNNLITPNDPTGILSNELPFTQAIWLNHDQNKIEIQFSSTAPVNESQNLYKYRLIGIDKTWYHTNQKSVSYTNLPPGKYTLEVQRANLYQTFPTARLKITVRSPWYTSWWGWTLWTTILLSCTGLTYRTLYARKKLKNTIRKEQMEKQHIKELNEAKFKFFTSVSHEFRTPLTLIIGQLEIIQQENELTQVTRNRFGKVIHQCRLLNDLITELIEFRKYEQGHYMLHVSPYPINQYIADICNSFQELASQRNIQIKMIPCKEELEVWFDGKQIKKVIYNLLSNAFKYTPENGTVSITLTSDRATNQLHISITDNGVGIEEKDLPHIFERFYQADNEIQDQKQFFRAGIGLALVKSIVEKHKGNIHVKSQPKQGSIFTLSLQLGKEHLTNHPHVRFTKEQDNTLPLLPDIPLPPNEKNDTEMELLIKQEKPIIVLIEDNTELLEVLVNIFTPLYTVKTAINGQEGLDIIRKVSPNLIVSDIMMPVMTGTELCNIIKNNIEFCHIPIILLTALNMPEQHLKGLLYGADDYICKPFRPQILLARCNNIIRSRKILYNQFAQKTEIDLSLLATNKLDKEFLDKVTVIIDENISNPEFNIDQLAQNMYMGRTSFYTKFKSLTGMSPRDFMIKHKLKQAMILLKQNRELSIKEISNTVGFSTPNYFCRLFKEQFNISPNQFRLKVQEKKDNNPTVECESE